MYGPVHWVGLYVFEYCVLWKLRRKTLRGKISALCVWVCVCIFFNCHVIPLLWLYWSFRKKKTLSSLTILCKIPSIETGMCWWPAASFHWIKSSSNDAEIKSARQINQENNSIWIYLHRESSPIILSMPVLVWSCFVLNSKFCPWQADIRMACISELFLTVVLSFSIILAQKQKAESLIFVLNCPGKCFWLLILQNMQPIAQWDVDAENRNLLVVSSHRTLA